MTQPGASAAFDMGRVIGRTFSLLERNFPPLSVFALIFVGLPQFISLWIQWNLPPLGDQGSAASVLRNIALALFTAAGACVMQGAVIHRAVTRFNDRRAQFGSDLSAGLRFCLSILTITLLTILMVGGGLVLLIVPGIIIAITLSVAVPVRVMEGSSIFGAFSRSAALTRGHRWRLLALFAILLVIGGILGGILGGLAGAIFGPSPLLAASMGTMRAAALLFNSVLVAAIYYELRILKEGVAADNTVSVFD